MSKDSVPAGQFLAYIEYLKPDQSNRFARLRPIYEIAKKSWRPIKDGNSLFLDEGLVFWWNPVSLASEGALWVVTLQSQHGYGSDFKHKDKFAVADARRPYQAITLQDVPGQKTFRRVLATGRFSIDTPIVGRPLVAIPGEVGRWIILPDSFRTSTHKEHVLITVPELEGVIPIYSVDTEAFEQIVVGAHHYSLSLVPGEAISYQCTLSDAQLIKHMRKRISSIDRTVLDGLDVTKKLLRKYLEVIDAAELGGGDAAKERVRREALISLVEGFDAEVDHIDKVVEILMEYPPFQERLEARSEKVLQQLREEKEKELIEEQHTANNRLSETRKN